MEKNKNDTKLSTEYWKLANKKLHPQISWSIKGKYNTYNTLSTPTVLEIYFASVNYTLVARICNNFEQNKPFW